jgi:predicted RNA binding protein YcfA (HicA-like mRNA interferase family)
MSVKYSEVLRLLKGNGWRVERVVGSHIQLRHPEIPGTVTVPGGGKGSKDVPPGTLNSILKQAG